jgi:two-component system response regulator AgrA
MLSVFICEDDLEEKEKITKCVSSYITMRELCMEVAFSTVSPEEVLNFRQNNTVDGLYFLDLELNASMDGLELAAKLREIDPRSFIVFITSYAEKMHLTFKYKVEAMDYITKDIIEIDSRIQECIDKAYAMYTKKPSPFHFKYIINSAESSIISLERSKILYFEAKGGHTIYVYSEQGRYCFIGNLTDIHESMGSDFFRCHKSVLVNLIRITELHIKEKKVLLGESAECEISDRCMKQLRKQLKKTPNRFNFA